MLRQPAAHVADVKRRLCLMTGRASASALLVFCWGQSLRSFEDGPTQAQHPRIQTSPSSNLQKKPLQEPLMEPLKGSVVGDSWFLIHLEFRFSDILVVAQALGIDVETRHPAFGLRLRMAYIGG